MSLVNTETGELVEPLTAMERSNLTHAEAKIEQGLTSFVEVGEALAEVRDARLYREAFGTFEAYCRDRWSLARSRAYQLIDASETTRALSTIVDTPPANEGQARALNGLDPQVAAETMQRAHDVTDGRVTAAAIREARPDVEPTPRPTPEPTAHVDLTAFINADPNVRLTRWRLAFMTDIKRAGELMLFTPEDVAEKADPDLIDELERLSKELINYIARVQAKRPTRLTAIRGGAK